MVYPSHARFRCVPRSTFRSVLSSSNLALPNSLLSAIVEPLRQPNPVRHGIRPSQQYAAGFIPGRQEGANRQAGAVGRGGSTAAGRTASPRARPYLTKLDARSDAVVDCHQRWMICPALFFRAHRQHQGKDAEKGGDGDDDAAWPGQLQHRPTPIRRSSTRPVSFPSPGPKRSRGLVIFG